MKYVCRKYSRSNFLLRNHNIPGPKKCTHSRSWSVFIEFFGENTFYTGNFPFPICKLSFPGSKFIC